MKTIKLLTALLTLSLTACASIKIPQSTGGSKSDGIIEMSYGYGDFEIPEVNYSKADESAVNSCKLWGYDNAHAFTGEQVECLSRDIYGGCSYRRVTIKYQCY